MKKAVLIFPDTVRMSDFLMNYRVSNAEANSFELSLIAIMTQAKIQAACKRYKARLRVAKPA